MNSEKPKVVLGLLGLRQDSGKGPKRWNKWRPSVSLALQKQFKIDTYHLIYHTDNRELANRLREDILEAAPQIEFCGHEILSDDAWDFEKVYGSLFEFSKTLKFNVEKQDLLVHMTTGSHVQQICLFLLTERGYLPGTLLQSIPLAGKESDPVGRHMFVDLNLENYKSLRTGLEIDRNDNLNFLKSGIQTQNKLFNHTIEMMEKVSLKSKEPMLITGPTGSGKSRIASQIYELKKNKHLIRGEYVELNCGTLQGNTTMSTLFGHKKGAFTGASNDRKGLLSKADGGVLFLDEIGELGLDEQAMLLTSIESKQFRPMGSDTEIYSDFILIAGTNRSLDRAVEKGTFREDLLARINLWTFELPALKERQEDIEPNLDYELSLASKKLSYKVSMMSPAKSLYMYYAQSEEGLWKHNFRDLNSSVMRMATLADAGIIDCHDVEQEWVRLKKSWGLSESLVVEKRDLAQGFLNKLNIEIELDPYDEILLEGTLKFILPYANMAEAGRHLYAKSRQHKKRVNDADRLKKFLNKFGLSWHDVKSLEKET